MTRRAAALSLSGWTAAAALVAALAAAPRLQRLARDYDRRLQPASDELEYYELGRALKFDGVFSAPGLAWSPSAHRGLLYPSFIAVSSGLTRNGPGSVRLSLFLLNMACVVLAWRLGAAVHSPAAGALSGLLFALAPGQIGASSSLYIESFYTFCLACAALAAVFWARDPSGRRSALLGLSLGVGLTCRSVFFALPPLLAAWALLRLPGFRKRSAVLLIAASYLPLIPWAARNYRQFREFIPFERHGATMVLYTASLGMDLGPTEDEAFRLFREQLRAEGRPSPAGPDSDGILLAAGRNIAAKPLQFAARTLLRGLRFAGMIVAQLHWIVLVPLILGLFAVKGNQSLEALWVVLLYFTAVYSPMSLASRYAVPVVPVLCVLAAAGAARFLPRGASGPPSSSEENLWLAVAHAPLFALYGAGILFLARESAALPAGAAVSQTADAFTGHRLGLELSVEGKFCDALGPLENSLQRPSKNPATASKLQSDLSTAEYLCGRRDSARRHLLQALALDPANESAVRSLPAVMGEEVKHIPH